ncbi:conserved hypothetical protein, partial [Listeria innocua FSL S4-378]
MRNCNFFNHNKKRARDKFLKNHLLASYVYFVTEPQ